MSKAERLQTTDTIVMVEPTYFGYNPQTAVDNNHQHKPTDSEMEIRTLASREFGKMVETLVKNDLKVVILDSPLGSNGEITPDAIFPNNWFSTHTEALVLYPMKAQNRRLERQPEELKKKLLGVNVLYSQTVDLTSDETDGRFLEGTGSLVLDRENKIAYAIESQRTSQEELDKWSVIMGYELFFFHAVDFGGSPVYHTNVVMSVGEDFAVVCTEAIKSAKESKMLIRRLGDTGKDVLSISMEKMYNMCGNILQTRNTRGEKMIVMSERARNAFAQTDMKLIKQNGLVVTVDIDVIETVGGGSARCMMAEVFY